MHSLNGPLPKILLIGMLHLVPICKMIAPNLLTTAAGPAAMVLRWAAAIAAMAGAYHTVSAASAAIVGLTKYNLNNTPAGTPTNNAVVPEGNTFRYRITVSNAGSDHKKDYFDCKPMPPGLTMNTNLGGNGFITNHPSTSLVPGVYPVTLVAGNTSYDTPVTYKATITITSLSTPPGIVTHPQSRTVAVGQTVEFTVSASGTEPLSYEWRRNTEPLPDQAGPTLTLSNVTADQAGSYSVVVRNSAGSATSNDAQLTVELLTALELRGLNLDGAFHFEAAAAATAPRYILYRTLDFLAWTAISTNIASGGKVLFNDPGRVRSRAFYVVQTAP